MALYRRDQALQAGTDPRQRRQSYLLGARQLRLPDCGSSAAGKGQPHEYRSRAGVDTTGVS